jgi:hypothetical protein
MEQDMPRTAISERIYETFFAKLAELETVSQETFADLRKLYESDQLANKRRIELLVRKLEDRHAKDKDANS